jgi:hypothetical protein
VSHQFYNVVHIVGIILLMSALGGAAVRAMGAPAGESRSTRRLLAILHGIGVFVVLLGGFGMLARLGQMGGASFPGWVWVKLVIWALLAAALFLPRRWPKLAFPLLLSLPLLGGLAAYMAIYKPLP